MKAIVIERPHEVAYREVDAPVCGPDEILVRSHKVGVCRTDLDVLLGELDPSWVRYPCIPGHEWSGSVVEASPNGDGLRAGDRVVCEGMIPCNACIRCRAGDTHLCETYDQLGFTRGGGYGELVAVPRRVVHRLPDSVSFDAAVLIEPASVVLRGLERGRPQPGETIGVIGIGTLGSLALVLARQFSPGELVAYGIRDDELELARRLGADRVVNVAEEEPESDLDLVIETAGAVAAVDLATRITRPGGRAVLLGIAGEGKVLELPPDRLTLRDVELIGSVAYTSSVWGRVVDLVSAGHVDLEPIVTHRFPASEFERAFELMDRREGIVAKVVLEHVPD